MLQYLILYLLFCSEINRSFQKCYSSFVQPTNISCESIFEFKQEVFPQSSTVLIKSEHVKYEDITETTFLNATNIIQLKIFQKLLRLNPGVFHPLRNVTKLVLFKNEIEEIRAAVFENLPLEILILQGNEIKFLQLGAFSSLTNLRYLSLKSNKINVILVGVFNNVPLRYLQLSHNRINYIESRAFFNMTYLKALDLSNNFLTTFKSQEVIDHGYTITKFLLHGNYLTEMSKYLLEGLENLEILDVERNLISDIQSEIFKSTPKLRILVLSHNKLTTINPDAFPKNGLLAMKKLHINNNQLSYLNTSVLTRLGELEMIQIGGNPWQCSCLNIIHRLISDHGVVQLCDKDYYSGSRPICVIPIKHPKNCVYEVDHDYYKTFNAANSLYPNTDYCDDKYLDVFFNKYVMSVYF